VRKGLFPLWKLIDGPWRGVLPG